MPWWGPAGLKYEHWDILNGLGTALEVLLQALLAPSAAKAVSDSTIEIITIKEEV